ncbi:MAG: hypothetical protein ACE5JP_14845 [Candidatus Bipolaricaulia bacterium]
MQLHDIRRWERLCRAAEPYVQGQRVVSETIQEASRIMMRLQDTVAWYIQMIERMSGQQFEWEVNDIDK